MLRERLLEVDRQSDRPLSGLFDERGPTSHAVLHGAGELLQAHAVECLDGEVGRRLFRQEQGELAYAGPVDLVGDLVVCGQRAGLDAKEGEGLGGQPRWGTPGQKRRLVRLGLVAIGQHASAGVRLFQPVLLPLRRVERHQVLVRDQADVHLALGRLDGKRPHVLDGPGHREHGKLHLGRFPLAQPIGRRALGIEVDAILFAGWNTLRQADVDPPGLALEAVSLESERVAVWGCHAGDVPRRGH